MMLTITTRPNWVTRFLTRTERSRRRDTLEQQDGELAAIQERDRQQVQNADVQADQGGQEDEVVDAPARRLGR